MNDADIEQLMHDVLDDVATPEEKTRLEQMLSTDAALRERFSALEQVFKTLNGVPLEEAPRDMHAELIQKIEHGAGATRQPGWMEALADAFRARPVPAFAMAIVSVTALGLLLWTGTAQRGAMLVDANLPVTGTMAPIDPAGALLEAGDARITITTERNAQALIVSIAGRAIEGTTLEIEFGSRLVGVDGPGAELLPQAPVDVSAPARLQLSGAVDARLRFELPAGEAGDMKVTLVTHGGEVERTISTGQGGKRP